MRKTRRKIDDLAQLGVHPFSISMRLYFLQQARGRSFWNQAKRPLPPPPLFPGTPRGGSRVATWDADVRTLNCMLLLRIDCWIFLTPCTDIVAYCPSSAAAAGVDMAP